MFVHGSHGACGGSRAYTSINDAVQAVAPGGVVHVCPGTYAEDVTVDKPVTLRGSHAVVAPDESDSSPISALVGGNNAFTVLAPWVTISGFTVHGATGDGIILLGDHGRIEHNRSTDNGINGINVDGSSWSVVKANTLSRNASGLELANDPAAAGIQLPGVSGTAAHDDIVDNAVVENPLACGILLVDHAGSAQGANLALGIHDNRIENNKVVNNAMAGFGAGILLATPAPGGAVYDNLIRHNTISGNGLSGVTVHSHLPSQDLNGNVVVGNRIGTSNLRGFQEPDDPQTTGVFVGSQSPLSITVRHNVIRSNTIGIFAAGGHVTVDGASANTFVDVTTPFATSPTFEGG